MSDSDTMSDLASDDDETRRDTNEDDAVLDAAGAEADVDVDAEVADAADPGDVVGEADELATAEAADGDADGDGAIGEDELLAEAAAAPVESPYDRPGRWYVVHAQSGYEKKVKQNLEARIASMGMEDRIYECVIPMEEVVEYKNGKKVTVQKKVFPGYLLVRCLLDDDSWYVVRNTPGIVSFIGHGGKPSPLMRRDVETFLGVKEEGKEAPAKQRRARLDYELGETVRVREGPFADFSGEI